MAVFNIAAGHGAGDSGAVYGARLEKTDNLKLALAVETELRKRGHTVRQYRYDDTVNCSASACRAWLENNKADFSIVFHRNAYKPNQATGVEVWSFDCDTISTQIAAEMSEAMANASALYNRGRKGNGAAWLSPNVPCCEPETGFIDNASDNTKFDNSFNAIVKAVCDTLEKHYGKGTDYGKGAFADDVIAIGTTTNFLNIRTYPVNGEVLVSMPTGSKCNIFSIEKGWAYLEYNGYKGYSSTDYMTIEYIVEKEKPKAETTAKPPETEENNKSSENNSMGAESEDNSNKGITPEIEKPTEAPPQSEPESGTTEAGKETDENIPILVKILKLVLAILKKLWSGRVG